MAADILTTRMRAYEEATRGCLPPSGYTLVKVFTRSFPRLLQWADKPFDAAVMGAMDAAAVRLCTLATGAQFAFVGESRIVLLLHGTPRQVSWFKGDAQAIASAAAGVVGAQFDREYTSRHQPDLPPATFRAHAFRISDPTEVARYFGWRQKIAVEQSVRVAARSLLGEERKTSMVQEHLLEAMEEVLGASYGESFSDRERRGGVVVRQPVERDDGPDTAFRASGAPVFHIHRGFLPEQIARVDEAMVRAS